MVQVKENPISILSKRADIEKNRVILPKSFIDQNGRYLTMEVYKDKIILLPQKEVE